jgi:thioredoxin-like negative regulator of GroEL
MPLALPDERMATIDLGLADVNDAVFEAEVFSSAKAVLVCFCRSAEDLDEATLARLAEENGARLTVVRALLRETPRAALKLGVVMTPAYLLFQAGTKRAVAVGNLGPEDLKEYVERAMR